MAIKVELEYCSGNNEMNKDRLRFIVYAKRQFVRQMMTGLRPVKRSWLSYASVKSRNGTVILPLDILITLRQYIDCVKTEEHTFIFKQTDPFEESMRPVLEQVKVWLRPRHHELVCDSCGKGYRSLNVEDRLCKRCWNNELRSFVDSVSDTVAGKTKGMHRSRDTVSMAKNEKEKEKEKENEKEKVGKEKGLNDERPDMDMDENCNLVPVVRPDKDKKARRVDLPTGITVPVKKKGRGRPKGVVLHDLRCQFCGNDFRSDNPRAVKCKPCTDSLRCHSCLKPAMRPDDTETLLCDSCVDAFRKKATGLYDELAEKHGWKPDKDSEASDKANIKVPKREDELIHTGAVSDKAVKKLGRPKKKVKMHECKCLICDELFMSDNPKAIKCKGCTVPPKEVKRLRLKKAKDIQLRKEKSKAYNRFNGDTYC